MTNLRHLLPLSAVLLAAGVLASGGAGAAADPDNARSFQVRLDGFEETPLTLSTTGSGTLSLRVDPAAGEIAYTLTYQALEGAVTQAHIHLGAAGLSGGISAFLCTNLGNGPAGTQACPAAPATVSGTLDAADVIGPAGQGITAGQMAELVQAISADATYVNVHSTLYPGGEIRSQIEHGHHHH